MRITTNQIFQRGLNGVLAQQAKTLNLQQQLSSQKKAQYPSDDPLAASQIDAMKQYISYTETLQKNLSSAESQLSFEENILANVVSVIQQLRVLQVEAGNSSLSAADRQAMAVSAQNLLNQLQDLGNTQGSDGYYLFSGGQTATEPFTINSSGSYVYNGDETQRFQLISSGVQIALNDNGNDVFMKIPNGNGTFTVSQTATPNTGNASATTGSMVNSAAYVVDNYTVQFVLNTQNQLVVMVSGAASGFVMPSDGNPDSAPLYQDGGAINFNGIQFTVTGTPQPGDAFAINPSQNQSIFATVAQMVANLNSLNLTPSENAGLQTINNQLMEQLDTALNNILSYEAQAGVRLNQLDIANQINADVIAISQETQLTLEDVNLAEAAVNLNLEQIYLEAAQQSFARIQGLTLFNYI